MKSKPLSFYPYICFDFDGVIKDSVGIKGDIFLHLLEPSLLYVTEYLLIIMQTAV